jgi:hypothetical protein
MHETKERISRGGETKSSAKGSSADEPFEMRKTIGFFLAVRAKGSRPAETGPGRAASDLDRQIGSSSQLQSAIGGRARFSVYLLLSPPRTPWCNGAIEAGAACSSTHASLSYRG